MQKHRLLLLAFIWLATVGQAQDIPIAIGTKLVTDPAAQLKKTDSLFGAQQYTQALEEYETLHASGRWSPAMLLRMAYIQEGLGRLGESLYYLNLYTLAANDDQATRKMEELAEKNHLEGYEADAWESFSAPLREYFLPITALLAAFGVLILAFALYKREFSMPLMCGQLALMLVLALHVQYGQPTARAIVTRPQTYVMSGPSGGAHVLGIIGEGNQVRIQGQQDVWLKVKWREREAYVKENTVRRVRL
jgi:hypothetical protein